tara:strand:+ start:5994 stop:6458 length:465 start_codon:yes stop_codon:yes gene_type:complete
MPDTIITYPAQKATIKALRGSSFKLIVNVKDSDGSDYDFTSDANDTTLGDDAWFKIYTKDGYQLKNSPNDTEFDYEAGGGITLSATNNGNSFSITVEDGKLTIEWVSTTQDFSPWPGRYKYTLYTVDSNEQKTIWLYGSFVVEDNNTFVLNDSV